MRKHERLHLILKVLVTIKREVLHNVLETSLYQLTNEGVIGVKKEKLEYIEQINLVNTKWKEFNQELINKELKKDINKVEKFYSFISPEINYNSNNKANIERIAKTGEESIKILETNIKFIEEKIDKLKFS